MEVTEKTQYLTAFEKLPSEWDWKMLPDVYARVMLELAQKILEYSQLKPVECRIAFSKSAPTRLGHEEFVRASAYVNQVEE